ncbi:MAG: TetR family transcriptional regulator [Candidatus Brevundimonas phytovorans]|nr:TetR/AcrR family transcriptional regulator [Brevundimonas sp.]WEK56751.1 MAG: TetR family transcriptional regulator [Brevundimonas sp.]
MPAAQVTPCLPRMRNAEATRCAILAAARKRFAVESYDDVGMRDIARDVGVDAAMITRYFGAKAELFASVLQSCGNASELIAGDRATFGRRMAEAVVNGGQPGRLEALQIVLRSLGSSRAYAIIRSAPSADFLAPLTAWIGGPEARVRARLASSLLMGVAVSHELSLEQTLPIDEAAALEAGLARLLQALIDEDQ